MPPQDIFEFTSFEIVSGAVLGRILQPPAVLLQQEAPVEVQPHASYTPSYSVVHVLQ